jgi:hypothetical protein
MPALRDLQARLAEAIVTGPSASAAAGIVGAGLPPERRLAIHHNHYRVSLIEALAATYAVVGRLVGPECFAAVARRYVMRRAPTRPCLFEYGGDFPDHLAADPATAGLVYLPDVARLDWAVNASFHAEDAPVLSPGILAAVPADRVAAARLLPHPAVRRVASPFPIGSIWQAHRPGGDAAAIDLAAGAERVLVWRDDDDVTWAALSPGGDAFIAGCFAGLTIGAAAARALAAEPALDFASTLGRLLAAPVFTALDPKGP